MTARQTDAITDPQSIIAALQQRLDAAVSEKATLAEELAARDAALALRNSEFGERIEQQTATIDVLKAMSASPGDPQPVFDLIVRRATELCNGFGTTLFEYNGGLVHFRASYFTEALDTSAHAPYAATFPSAPTRGSISSRAILDREIVHIRDTDADLELSQVARELHKATLHRSQLSIPLMRDGQAIGVISLALKDPGGFSDSQIEMLKTFAEQAVIAISSAEMYRALQTRTADLQESLEYQTATSDVLKVISQSTFDLQAVLDTVAQTAARLCDADQSVIFRSDGELRWLAANHGYPPNYEASLQALGQFRVPPDSPMPGARSERDRRPVHIHDVTVIPGYSDTSIRLGGTRTVLGVPLLRGDEAIGSIALSRRRIEPFTDRQIELVRTFADQAVIAIENARLITAQREALEQQTATAEVLGVINRSPGDLSPVFEAILEKAHALCGVTFGTLLIREGEALRVVATHGEAQFVDAGRQLGSVPPPAGSAVARLVAGEIGIVHVADMQADESYRNLPAKIRHLHEIGGIRTFLMVSLRKDDGVLGAITAFRQEVRPFTEKQIALLQNFAAQAVIAMENARLITEQREALEQQTATAEVLGVINSSPGALGPVFDAILEKAHALCGAATGSLQLYDGEFFRAVATRGLPEEFANILRQPRRSGLPDDLLRNAPFVQITDVLTGGDKTIVAAPHPIGVRTLLRLPLRKDDALLGMIVAGRREVRPFSPKEISLLQSFAAQAVIAMENARLLEEIRQRQAELRVTFDNMADGVAMFDGNLRLAAWNRNFQELLDFPAAVLAECPTYAEYLRILAERGEFGTEDIEAGLGRRLEHTDRELRLERARPNGQVIEVRRNAVPDGGFVLIYSDITDRKRSEAETRAARDAAEVALRDLKAAQANLIQAEKMASLGQLTAGIAHEIKNPLNFVNNFAALSVDLLSELKETAAPGFAALTDDQRADIDDVSAMLTSNLEKITEHGKRADGIVKAMLEHSRGSSAERRMVDLNALIDEALNLAYHGARAQDQSFNVTLERDFGEGIAPTEVNPQDITRVFLNIFSNGFYAATRRARNGGDAGFVPMLKVTTRDAGEAVEIRVRDNGTGILADIRDKLFQPFFTTKPTGEGTGLGLSITYDIVTKQHGGTITVDSEVDAFTEFVVTLPRRMFTNGGSRT